MKKTICSVIALLMFVGTSVWASEPAVPYIIDSNSPFNVVKHFVPESVSSFTVTAFNSGSRLVSVRVLKNDASFAVVFDATLRPRERREYIVVPGAPGEYVCILGDAGNGNGYSEGVNASFIVTN